MGISWKTVGVTLALGYLLRSVGKSVNSGSLSLVIPIYSDTQ